MINAQEVEDLFFACTWTEDEVARLGEDYLTEKSLMLEGLTITAAFDPSKVELHEKRIAEILAELNPQFFPDGGGGSSFLQLPFTADDEQWGEHRNAEQLMLLGMAINKVKYAINDRTIWAAMPGSLPYIIINLEGFEDVQPEEES